MEQKVNYHIVSQYRTEIMGIAMLLILFYHSSFPVLPPIVKELHDIAYFGVDIFILMSGMGLYVSLERNNSIISFLKKRFLRIVPIYVPVVFLYSVISILKDHHNISLILWNCTTLSFWMDLEGAFNWYVPALVALYLLAPFYYRIMKKVKNKEIFTQISIICGLCVCLFMIKIKAYHLLILFSRLPIFFIGFWFGNKVLSNQKVSKKFLVFNIFGSVVGGGVLVYWMKIYDNDTLRGYGLWWYPFIFIAPLLVLGLGRLFQKIGRKEYKILIFFGKNSLEIFLVNICVVRFGYIIKQRLQFDTYNVIYNLICFILNLGIGIMYINCCRLVKKHVIRK